MNSSVFLPMPTQHPLLLHRFSDNNEPTMNAQKFDIATQLALVTDMTLHNGHSDLPPFYPMQRPSCI